MADEVKSEPLYTGWLWHPDQGAKGFKNITMEEKADLFREGWVDYHDRPNHSSVTSSIPVIDFSVPESESDESDLPVAELLPIPEEEPEPKRRGPGRPPKAKV